MRRGVELEDLEQKRLEEVCYSGAGNRFLLIDGRYAAVAPEQLETSIRDLNGHTHAPDGLLLLEPAERFDARLTIVNRDGTRASACGNGLRCVGLHLALEARAVGHGRTEYRVLTDAGPRRVECAVPTADLDARCEASARAEIGLGRVVESAMRAVVGNRTLVGAHVEVGNTHFVLFVDDVESAPVADVGSALTSHAGFAEGANVGFAQRLGSGRLGLRVYERGVGETMACGTGAAAAALAAGDALPVEVSLRGGSLRIERDGEGVLWLAGPATRHAP